VTGVPRGLLDQVEQDGAQVAFNDVRPRARGVEVHRRGDGAGPFDLVPVVPDPLLHRVVLIDREVLGHARVVDLWPLAGELPPRHTTWSHRRSHNPQCLTMPSSDSALAVGAFRAVASSSPSIFLITASR
jgi:hypothetical protein